jgi:ABC-type sugar transport system permease subunit
VFDQPCSALNNGGPGTSTSAAHLLYMYRTAFGGMRVTGTAGTIAVVLTLLSLVFTLRGFR